MNCAAVKTKIKRNAIGIGQTKVDRGQTDATSLFTYVYIQLNIEGIDPVVRAAACRRLGKHKYAVDAMLRCEDIKPEALDIICKIVRS